MKTQPMNELFAEMRAVALGEIPAPADAALPSKETATFFVERREKADFTAFDCIMQRKGGEPARPEDILE